MTSHAAAIPRHSTARRLLNKVPEVTLFFWVIKIMATTVGETAADWPLFQRNYGFWDALFHVARVTIKRQTYYLTL